MKETRRTDAWWRKQEVAVGSGLSVVLGPGDAVDVAINRIAITEKNT